MYKKKIHLVQHSDYKIVVAYCGRRLCAFQKFTRLIDKVTCEACIKTFNQEKNMPEQLTFLEEE